MRAYAVAQRWPHPYPCSRRERLGTAIVHETQRLNDRFIHMTPERLIDRCERLGSPLFHRISERLIGR